MHGSMGLVQSNFESYQYYTTNRAGIKQPSWNSAQNLSSWWAASRSVVMGGAVLSSSYSTGKPGLQLSREEREMWNPEKSTEPRNFHMAFEALGWQCQFRSLSVLLHPFAHIHFSSTSVHSAAQATVMSSSHTAHANTPWSSCNPTPGAAQFTWWHHFSSH